MTNKYWIIALTVIANTTAFCQTGKGKILDVRPYASAGPSIVAPNNGYPLVIPTSRNMFSLTVSLDDMIYSIEVKSSHHVKPSDFIVGDPIDAHVDKDKLIVQDPSGKEIKEKIVRRERLANPK